MPQSKDVVMVSSDPTSQSKSRGDLQALNTRNICIQFIAAQVACLLTANGLMYGPEGIRYHYNSSDQYYHVRHDCNVTWTRLVFWQFPLGAVLSLAMAYLLPKLFSRFGTCLAAAEYLLSILDKPPNYLLSIIDDPLSWETTRPDLQSDTYSVGTSVDNKVQEAPVDGFTLPGLTEYHSKPSSPSGTSEDHSKQASIDSCAPSTEAIERLRRRASAGSLKRPEATEDFPEVAPTDSPAPSLHMTADPMDCSVQNTQALLEAEVRKLKMELQGAREECERLQVSDRRSREQYQGTLERYKELLSTHETCRKELDREKASCNTQMRESNRLLVSCKRVWTMARVRKSAAEKEEQAHSDIEVLDSQRIKFHKRVKDGIASPDKTFRLDHVFSSSSSNADVWKVVRMIVDVPLFSQDALIIMNGQSGTGKSHSMFCGDDAIAHAAAERFFSWRPQLDLQARPGRIVVTALEVYNDTLRDLLGGSDPGGVKLIRSDSGFAVKGVVESEIVSMEALHDLFDRACRNREVRKTPKNPVSSRGHLVCEITLLADKIRDEKQMRHRLCLVDLAGSEHSSQEATSDSQRETQFISMSRTNLQTALANFGKSFVSAEDTLSKVLKGYLHPKSLVLLLAHLSPLSIDDGFTLGTLEYADKVREKSRTSGRVIPIIVADLYAASV